MAVSTTHKLYDEHIPQSQLVRTILAGGDAVRKNASKYIPKPSALDDKEYKAMVNRPSFDNVLERMLDTFTGLVFAKEPTLEAPTRTMQQLEEIDLTDNTYKDMSKKIFQELFISGRVGCLVDVSNTQIMDKDLAPRIDSLDIRPYISFYPTESIINWRMENNKFTLIVLRELHEIAINKFEVEEQMIYRVLELDEDGYYKQSLMTEIDKKDSIISEIYPTQNGQKMRYIPFYPATAKTLSIEPIKPPLWDMADANLSMHKLKIDLYHALYFTIPTPFMTGVQDNEAPSVVLGSTQVHAFSNPQADMRYLEFSGQGLTHISNEIKDCKLTMGSLGAEFLRDNTKKGEAVETVAMRNAGDRATLQDIASVVNRLMTKLIEEMARYNKESDTNIIFELNTDFDNKVINEALIKVVSDNVQMNLVPKQVLFNLLQKAELIPAKMETYEDFQNSLEVQEFDIGLPQQQDNSNDTTGFINSVRNRLGI